MSVRNQKLAGVSLFAALTALLVWRVVYPAEPVYNGKPLSVWAEHYYFNRENRAVGESVLGEQYYSDRESRAVGDEAEFAIRQIGTNAIPFLLDRIRVRDSGMKRRLRAMTPRSWHYRLHLTDFTSENVRRVGAYGLAALGTNAADALPTLVEIATHHPDADGRYIAVSAIKTLNAAAEPAIPFLIQCLTNEYFNIRADAAWGLGYLKRQPEIVVPALVRYLEFARASPHMNERIASIDSLTQFGTNARSAAPLVSSLLTNPVPIIRIFATNALLRMEVETSVKPQ